MKQRFTIKNQIKETHLFRRRIIVALFLIFSLTLVLLARLFYLQIFQYNLYTTMSKQNEIVLSPIVPRRGLIFDRNGMLLAKNTPVYSLMLTPYEVKDIQETLSEITKIVPLSDNDLQQFYKQLKQRRRFDQIPLKLKLSDEEVARFAVNRYRFPGVVIKAELIRNYPLGNAFAQVLGYVSRINDQDLSQIDPTNYAGTNFIGKIGIEKYYESQLHGNVGYEKTESDVSGQTVRTLQRTEPIQGDNIYLTIDTGLQIAAEEALGDQRGAVVAIDPNTGEILALASQPSYDPNLFVTGISQKDYTTLQNDPNHPLYNRALRGLYAPGSTIKPFVAIGGLNDGATTPSFEIFDPGWYTLPHTEHVFHDWKANGHGWVNLTSAIIQSCDTYFFDLAHKLGVQQLNQTFYQFGFGKVTGVDLGEELSGNVPTPQWKLEYSGKSWYPGDTVQSGIGQGFLQATPLQLAAATAALAEHGSRYQPHLLLKMQLPDNSFISQGPIALPSITLNNPKYWNIVINAMQGVITQGTAFRFGKTPYTVAAKTGTAQLISMEKSENRLIPVRLRDNSLFIAFAPVQHPQIAVSVIVENAETATTVARKVIDYYLIQEKHNAS